MESDSEDEPPEPTAPASDGSKNGKFKDVRAEALLDEVHWEESIKAYKISLCRDGKTTGRSGKTRQEAADAGAKWHAELDAAGVPKTIARKKKSPVEHQSGVDGVTWNKTSWIGIVGDRLATAKAGKRRVKFTKNIYKNPHSKADIEACRVAREALIVEEAREYEEHVAARVAEIPHLQGLSRTPNFELAKFGQVYVHAHGYTTPPHEPYAVVLVKNGSTFGWTNACRHDTCTNIAIDMNGNQHGLHANFCIQHGGGKRCHGPLNGNGECPLGIAICNKNQYDGFCMNCFCSANPNDPKAIAARSYVHAREKAVVELLKEAFPDHNWVFDKSYGSRTILKGTRTSTSRCRPDARFRNADRVIIVEVDEDSHRAYLCAKEREREASFVAQAGREGTVVMIRFNPDKYVDVNGVKHKSCFVNNSRSPRQKKQWDARMSTLIDTIRYVADPDNELPPKQDERPCLMIELFYDNISKMPEEERAATAKKQFKAISSKKREAAASAGASTSKAPKTS